MYHNPKRAKRLYFDCIPKSMDEYKKIFESIASQDQSKKIENPIWHIHQKNIPSYSYPIDFTTLLNLVTALNTTEATTIKEFVRIYIKESLTKETSRGIIKEETVKVMSEMDAPQDDPLEGFKNALKAAGSAFVTFDFDFEEGGSVLRIDTTVDGAGGVYRAKIDKNSGELILDFDSSSEQIVGKDEALEYLLNL